MKIYKKIAGYVIVPLIVLDVVAFSAGEWIEKIEVGEVAEIGRASCRERV